MTLYLGSQSPRRAQLLTQLGVAFTVHAVAVPEERSADETPQAYVRRVARAKAIAALATLEDVRGALVLGADTEVVLDGAVFGKPVDATDAARMLGRLAGRTHEVMSAVWLVGAGREASASCVSRVTFAPVDRARIDAYVAGGEPFGKAGAYAIQGRAAAFVAHLSGSYSNVVGLPLYETAQLLRAAGVAVP